MRVLAKITAVLLATMPASAWAAETITYSYDARGRLVSVSHSGTVNNGASTTYVYDKADNRTTVTTVAGGGGMAAAGSAQTKPTEDKKAPPSAQGAPQ